MCVCVHLCRSAEYSTALPQLSADQPIKRHSQPRLRPLRQTATSSPSPSVWRSKRMMGRAHLGESLCYSPSIKVDSVLPHISAFNPRGLVSNWIIQLGVFSGIQPSEVICPVLMREMIKIAKSAVPPPLRLFLFLRSVDTYFLSFIIHYIFASFLCPTQGSVNTDLHWKDLTSKEAYPLLTWWL